MVLAGNALKFVYLRRFSRWLLKNLHVQLGGKFTNALKAKYHKSAEVSISVTPSDIKCEQISVEGRQNLN